jgi:hypothetical protein
MPRILRRDAVELPMLEERELEMDVQLEAREPEPAPEPEPEPIVCGGKFNPCSSYKTAPGRPRILRRDVVALSTLEERELEMDMELEVREPEPEPEPIVCGGKFNPCSAYKSTPGMPRIL